MSVSAPDVSVGLTLFVIPTLARTMTLCEPRASASGTASRLSGSGRFCVRHLPRHSSRAHFNAHLPVILLTPFYVMLLSAVQVYFAPAWRGRLF